jgi:hypothetical protein
MDKTFLRFGKFSASILLNVLHAPLASIFSSSIPTILRFSVLMESLSSGIFLSQLLSCLTKSSSVFFSLISILSLSLCFYLPLVSSSQVVSHCIFHLTKGSFYFQGFCLILFSEVFHILVQFFYYNTCCHL